MALLISILACDLPVATSPAIFYVRTGDTSSDSNDCRSADHACHTVRAAVGKATVGSTINIGAGTFAETAMITLDKNLVLLGSRREATTITSSDRDWVFNIRAAGIRLQDLTVSGADNTTDHVAGIQIYNVSNVVLERVTIRDQTSQGLVLTNGALTLIDCIFQGNGLALSNAGGLLQISNSTFQLNTGIALYNNGITTVTTTTFT